MGKRSRKRAAEPAAKPARKASAKPAPKAPAAGPARKPDADTDATNGSPADPPDSGRGRGARSAAKDAAARAALEPLAEGERPTAVTVAAVVAALFAAGNLIAYLAGTEIGGERPALPGILSYTALMLIAAWGMWRAKYWAVLGMQAILGILILIFSVLLFTASNLAAVAISLAVIVPGGALFYFLIKAMARIQMPERAPR